jgi:hypothetical protein
VVPSDLIKQDLDGDGSVELLVLMRLPDGADVIPGIYSTNNGFKRIFPENNQETNPLICREIFISNHAGQPALCTRHLIAYHDFGPPELYRLEFYNLQKGSRPCSPGVSEGDHFKDMNKGALLFITDSILKLWKL